MRYGIQTIALSGLVGILVVAPEVVLRREPTKTAELASTKVVMAGRQRRMLVSWRKINLLSRPMRRRSLPPTMILRRCIMLIPGAVLP